MREVITTPPGPARDELTDTRVSQNLCFRIPPDTHWQKISGEGLIVLMRLVPPQEGLAPLYFKAADIIPPKPETAPAGTLPAIAEPDAYPSPESSSPAPALPGETPQSPDTSETAAPSLPEWTGYALAAIVALALLLAAPRLHLIAELIRVRPAFALIAFTLTAAAAIWLH
ncbi:hypothetical protein AOE01nite_24370 [Acetobacter oeni]|uniref:Uncharacterized protein n=2 Tax=Acetobacter oeni TaxID=304077 RepID=A0A511XMN9_9PROT|nr:hypothetical protein AA21952_1402 [Acetobacter oeni LMG 21952]GEN64213.1 hypothetical protein AOE01nite_24370 [Acetobacter oeni]